MLASREKGQLPWPGHGPPAETRQLYGAEVIAVAQGESGAGTSFLLKSRCRVKLPKIAGRYVIMFIPQIMGVEWS